MIVNKTGSIFDSTAQALVNPVNCQGVSGAGLAREFRLRYPDTQRRYRMACEMGLSPGNVFVALHNPGPWKPVRWIIYFPTKDKWRGPSKSEYIRDGLVDLVQSVKKRPIESIAIPALGCGLGGLDWAAVRTLIVAAFEELPEVTVELYGPKGVRL